jgi:hypothetical protein
MILWGVGLSLSDAANQALLHRMVPSTDIAPIAAVVERVKLLSEGAGSLGAPVLLSIISPRSAIMVVGFIVPLAALLALRSREPRPGRLGLVC